DRHRRRYPAQPGTAAVQLGGHEDHRGYFRALHLREQRCRHRGSVRQWRNAEHGNDTLDHRGCTGWLARQLDRREAIERITFETGTRRGVAFRQCQIDDRMIDVAEAKQRVIAAAARMSVERVALIDALERYPAEDVIAPFDHPLFD